MASAIHSKAFRGLLTALVVVHGFRIRQKANNLKSSQALQKEKLTRSIWTWKTDDPDDKKLLDELKVAQSRSHATRSGPFGSDHRTAVTLSKICSRLIQKFHETYQVKVANINIGGLNVPTARMVRLKYMRALLGADEGNFDFGIAHRDLADELNRATKLFQGLFQNCMNSKRWNGKLLQWQQEPWLTIVSASLAYHYKVGNCGEMSSLSFLDATHWGHEFGFNVERVGGVNYDHAWTVFNRNAQPDDQQKNGLASDRPQVISDPTTWNAGAVICDNWMGCSRGDNLEGNGGWYDPIRTIQKPEDVYVDVNHSLTNVQKTELVEKKKSYFLYHHLRSFNIYPPPGLEYVTEKKADSKDVLEVYKGQSNLTLWENPSIDCAQTIDRQLKEHIKEHFGDRGEQVLRWVTCAFAGECA